MVDASYSRFEGMVLRNDGTRANGSNQLEYKTERIEDPIAWQWGSDVDCSHKWGARQHWGGLRRTGIGRWKVAGSGWWWHCISTGTVTGGRGQCALPQVRISSRGRRLSNMHILVTESGLFNLRDDSQQFSWRASSGFSLRKLTYS